MLVDFVVLVFQRQSCFVGLLSLEVVIVLFIQEPNLEECVDLALHGEGVGENRILKVANGLFNLVGFGENHSQLVKHFRFLIKVRRHLEDSNQGTNCVIVRFKLLIEDANAVPQLWVLDIVKRV